MQVKCHAERQRSISEIIVETLTALARGASVALAQGIMEIMNLDNLDLFKKIDTQNLLAEIDSLPGQLQQAWELGQTLTLPDFAGIQNIVFAGMGDSAVSAELVTASVFSNIRLPVTIHRGYGLPASASDKRTLVICISQSGNTEETLDAFETALKNDTQILVISAGGELTKRAAAKKCPCLEL